MSYVKLMKRLAVGYKSSYVMKIRWVYILIRINIPFPFYCLSMMIDLNMRNPNKYSSSFVRRARKLYSENTSDNLRPLCFSYF